MAATRRTFQVSVFINVGHSSSTFPFIPPYDTKSHKTVLSYPQLEKGKICGVNVLYIYKFEHLKFENVKKLLI